MQYYDAMQRVGHVSRERNADGVGIEFSNIVFTNLHPGQQLIPPGMTSDRTPRSVSGWW